MGYIDREEAAKIIDSYAKAIDYDCNNCKVVVNTIKDIVTVICPTADVVEVKYSSWMSIPCRAKYKAAYECRRCGRVITRQKESYCPSCGAKMDGKENT